MKDFKLSTIFITISLNIKENRGKSLEINKISQEENKFLSALKGKMTKNEEDIYSVYSH